ncbi:MAG: Transcriptional regulator, ArsR family [Parcubacteria group bacterium GW2011_GWA1_43_27]|nr:MAG: Transcriptional regulator, ArsR family [Parcubacteria group bacterium GW2011_GWA1_43_27]
MFNKVLRQHAELLKVLANPKRLEVLYLLRQGELTVSDIELATGMRQANLSQHLMVLRNAGIVSSKHISVHYSGSNIVPSLREAGSAPSHDL